MVISFNDNISKAIEFVNICSTYRSPIDLIIDRHYIVDAKSAMGVYAYAAGHLLEVEMTSENPDELNKFIDEMREKYEVKADGLEYTE